jgi:hypothetical protein
MASVRVAEYSKLGVYVLSLEVTSTFSVSDADTEKSLRREEVSVLFAVKSSDK